MKLSNTTRELDRHRRTLSLDVQGGVVVNQPPHFADNQTSTSFPQIMDDLPFRAIRLALIHGPTPQNCFSHDPGCLCSGVGRLCGPLLTEHRGASTAPGVACHIAFIYQRVRKRFFYFTSYSTCLLMEACSATNLPLSRNPSRVPSPTELLNPPACQLTKCSLWSRGPEVPSSHLGNGPL